MIARAVTACGAAAIFGFEWLWSRTLFIGMAVKIAFTTRLNGTQTIQQLAHIGVGSLLIVMLTGSCTGLALALQSFVGFRRLGAQEFSGLVVTLGMIRELGPVLTGLMVAGRAGSSMAAELATMRITEQIDALQTLRVNPFAYLIVPRIVACIIALPLLALIACACGIACGYFLCINSLGLNAGLYTSLVHNHVEPYDLMSGLIKAAVFGCIIGTLGTMSGYFATGGARGVGSATTMSVVASSVAILIANYFLSILLLT